MANCLLGITGSIAAIKIPQLLDNLSSLQINLKCITTRNAYTILDLSHLKSRFSESDLYLQHPETFQDQKMPHIELAKWATIILIAPATANFIAKLACGIADDLLSTLCLATHAKIVIAPAMNKSMWTNPATAENIQKLITRGVELVGPVVGRQACGDYGMGRMADPPIIAAKVKLILEFKGLFEGRKVVVTAGPTREPLDPVRFLSNRSSGKMGFALAQAFVEAGAETVLISGPTELSPPRCKVISVKTASEMHKAALSHTEGADIFVSCAAVANYRPKEYCSEKIKSNQKEILLKLTKTPDILKSVAERRGSLLLVGFAAETEDIIENAKKKLERKGVEVIVANKVGEAAGFEVDETEVFLISRKKAIEELKGPKTAVAYGILRFLSKY